MAPEVMEQLQGYDNKADVWSVGITALELAKGVAPYAHHSPMRVLVLTIEEEPPSLKCYRDGTLQRTGEPFSPLFEDFYKKCLQKNPRSRPSADDLLRHKFLKSHASGRVSFVSQLLSLIPPVGSEITTSDGRIISDADDREILPGESSVAVTVERWNYDSADGPHSRKANSRSPADALLSGAAAAAGVGASSSSSGKFAKGTTWVFDGDDIDEWKADALGEGSEALKSCSGVVARKSGSFTPDKSDAANTVASADPGAAEVSHYRITVQGLSKSGGASGPTKAPKPSAGSAHSEPIDDFLRDFENEIVLENAPAPAVPVSTAEVVPPTAPTDSKEKDFR